MKTALYVGRSQYFILGRATLTVIIMFISLIVNKLQVDQTYFSVSRPGYGKAATVFRLSKYGK